MNQFEMLMNHADPQCIGVIGILDPHFLPIFFDDTLFRLIQAEKDTHQRRLPRSVLTQQSVDLALFELEGDIIVGISIMYSLIRRHFPSLLVFRSPAGYIAIFIITGKPNLCKATGVKKFLFAPFCRIFSYPALLCQRADYLAILPFFCQAANTASIAAARRP